MTDPESYRNLPAAGFPRLKALLIRALLRRCPQCGSGEIFRNYWSLKELCPRCHYQFDREEGYFLGGYAVNLVVAEILGLGSVLVLLFRTDYSLWAQEIIAIGAAIGLPILFYPYSRTLWMAIDLLADRGAQDDRLRLEEMMKQARQRDKEANTKS